MLELTWSQVDCHSLMLPSTSSKVILYPLRAVVSALATVSSNSCAVRDILGEQLQLGITVRYMQNITTDLQLHVRGRGARQDHVCRYLHDVDLSIAIVLETSIEFTSLDQWMFS